MIHTGRIIDDCDGVPSFGSGSGKPFLVNSFLTGIVQPIELDAALGDFCLSLRQEHPVHILLRNETHGAGAISYAIVPQVKRICVDMIPDHLRCALIGIFIQPR